MSDTIDNPVDGDVAFAGVHLLAELWEPVLPEDPALLEQVIIEAARHARCQVISVKCHEFQPHGLTGFAILAESHLSIHSWPELNYLAVDIFTCGTNTDPHAALRYLKRTFQPCRMEIIEVKRGLLDGAIQRRTSA